MSTVCRRKRVSWSDRCGGPVHTVGIPRGTRPPVRSKTPACCRPKR
ncbi:MAG TPA: hypothetical protein VIU16_06675 [Gaiellaceae bacterium]